jgi:hypothetical protein
VKGGAPGGRGPTRRRIRVQVDTAACEVASRLLARWTTRQQDGQFLVEHDSGRDVNAALAAGGVIAESVTVELPRLEDRFLEIGKEEDARVVAAGS